MGAAALGKTFHKLCINSSPHGVFVSNLRILMRALPVLSCPWLPELYLANFPLAPLQLHLMMNGSDLSYYFTHYTYSPHYTLHLFTTLHTTLIHLNTNYTYSPHYTLNYIHYTTDYALYTTYIFTTQYTRHTTHYTVHTTNCIQ